jgi:hypothetical protein
VIAARRQEAVAGDPTNAAADRASTQGATRSQGGCRP